MANHTLDAKGLKCPEPILKITVKSAGLQPGDTLEVVADCTTFERDVRTWSERLNKPILWVRHEDNNAVRIQIQF